MLIYIAQQFVPIKEFLKFFIQIFKDGASG